MTTEQNKAIVRRFYDEVLNRQHLDAIDALCAPTYHGDAPGADCAAFKQFYRRFLGAFPDLRLSLMEPGPSVVPARVDAAAASV